MTASVASHFIPGGPGFLNDDDDDQDVSASDDNGHSLPYVPASIADTDVAIPGTAGSAANSDPPPSAPPHILPGSPSDTAPAGPATAPSSTGTHVFPDVSPSLGGPPVITGTSSPSGTPVPGSSLSNGATADVGRHVLPTLPSNSTAAAPWEGRHIIGPSADPIGSGSAASSGNRSVVGTPGADGEHHVIPSPAPGVLSDDPLPFVYAPAAAVHDGLSAANFFTSPSSSEAWSGWPELLGIPGLMPQEAMGTAAPDAHLGAAPLSLPHLASSTSS
jgi:hypothetical protein